MELNNFGGTVKSSLITISHNNTPVLLNIYTKDGAIHFDYAPENLTPAAEALILEVARLQSAVGNVRGTVEYLSTKAFAERLGMSPGYFRELRMKDRLPVPDAMIADRPGWLPATVDRWKAGRAKA